MSIVYIEFGTSKSKHYKQASALAKRLPNYANNYDKTVCYVDDILDYIKHQNTVIKLIELIAKWKSSNILLLDKEYSGPNDITIFLNILSDTAGKYKTLIRNRVPLDIAINNTITYEELPLPIVYYPSHYGAFFAFSKDVGEKIYFCECERKAIENYLILRTQNPLKYYHGSKTYPLGSDYFPEKVAELSKDSPESPLSLFEFAPNICFRCNNKIPMMKYCDPMYGGNFLQHYGWYIHQKEFALGVDPYQLDTFNILPDECTPEIFDYVYRLHILMNNHSSNERDYEQISLLKKEYSKAVENSVREEFGYPKIGEHWISETILYHIVESLYPNVDILRHHRPKWLNNLELDIYIPNKKLAFEYQGIQHFKAVDHWGGQQQLEKQQQHDRVKKQICQELGIKLICINYYDELTTENIERIIDTYK